MKKARGFFLAILILFVAGCNKESSLIEEQQSQLGELREKITVLKDTINKQQNIIDSQNKEFSYLSGFTKEELEAYGLFVKDKETQHLHGISPERIVLIYLQSVVVGDIEAIYSLTYDNGTLPDLSTFRQKYYTEGLHEKELETTLDYRYYDSIKVREENKTEHDVSVELSVNYGNYHPAVIFGLKKENEIWKMDILHLMEYLKERNK